MYWNGATGGSEKSIKEKLTMNFGKESSSKKMSWRMTREGNSQTKMGHTANCLQIMLNKLEESLRLLIVSYYTNEIKLIATTYTHKQVNKSKFI